MAKINILTLNQQKRITKICDSDFENDTKVMKDSYNRRKLLAQEYIKMQKLNKTSEAYLLYEQIKMEESHIVAALGIEAF